jgi:mono/diheme cytochrome c family protein
MPGRSLSASSTLALAALLGATAALSACGRPQPDIRASTLQTPDATASMLVGTSGKDPATAAADAVTRGAYLVAIGGCNDCHTPMRMGPTGPEPDTSLMLSGHPASAKLPPPPRPEGPWLSHGTVTGTAYAGPWGVSYAINLTPDEETGIGAWSEKVFVNTLRTGKHLGVGRPILPPMPWKAYGQMTEDDLKAIFAYLKTVPPVKNKVPEPVIAPPPQS